MGSLSRLLSRIVVSVAREVQAHLSEDLEDREDPIAGSGEEVEDDDLDSFRVGALSDDDSDDLEDVDFLADPAEEIAEIDRKLEAEFQRSVEEADVRMPPDRPHWVALTSPADRGRVVHSFPVPSLGSEGIPVELEFVVPSWAVLGPSVLRVFVEFDPILANEILLAFGDLGRSPAHVQKIRPAVLVQGFGCEGFPSLLPRGIVLLNGAEIQLRGRFFVRDIPSLSASFRVDGFVPDAILAKVPEEHRRVVLTASVGISVGAVDPSVSSQIPLSFGLRGRRTTWRSLRASVGAGHVESASPSSPMALAKQEPSPDFSSSVGSAIEELRSRVSSSGAGARSGIIDGVYSALDLLFHSLRPHANSSLLESVRGHVVVLASSSEIPVSEAVRQIGSLLGLSPLSEDLPIAPVTDPS